MLQVLRARWYLTVAVVLVAVVAAAAVKVSSKSTPTGLATVQILVDSPQSALADLKQDPAPLVTRAPVFAQVMTSNAILTDIAHAAGVNPSALTAEGPYSGGAEPLDVPTPSPARSVQIIAGGAAYHFTFVADATIPMVTASVEGPNPAAAVRLANAVAPGVRTWLNALEGAVPASHRVTIRELGNAQAGSLSGSSTTTPAAIIAVAVLLLGMLLIVAVDRRARAKPDLASAAVESGGTGFDPDAAPVGVGPNSNGGGGAHSNGGAGAKSNGGGRDLWLPEVQPTRRSERNGAGAERHNVGSARRDRVLARHSSRTSDDR
jgi:hypothetical protein